MKILKNIFRQFAGLQIFIAYKNSIFKSDRFGKSLRKCFNNYQEAKQCGKVKSLHSTAI
jgi:hypothetical protein